MGANDQAHLGEGWHGLEEIPERARWSSARATFRIAAGAATRLLIRCLSYKPELEQAPVRGHVEIDGRTIGTFTIAAVGWQCLAFPLPANGGARSEQATIDPAIVVHNPWRPSDLLNRSVFEAVIGSPRVIAGSRDTRLLGIVVQRIWVE
jgi:hypothetical protein